MKIKESAIATVFSAEKEHTAEFTFVGHQGRPFGQPIVVRFKVVKKIDELELYQKAMELFETQESEANTFEEIVDALKQTNNDPDQAKNLLAQKKCGMTVQAAEEEDLYSWVSIPKFENWRLKLNTDFDYEFRNELFG